MNANANANERKATHYKELIVWQVGMRLAQGIYKVSATFPAEERYGLALQMRRAAVSIPSNIILGGLQV